MQSIMAQFFGVITPSVTARVLSNYNNSMNSKRRSDEKKPAAETYCCLYLTHFNYIRMIGAILTIKIKKQ